MTAGPGEGVTPSPRKDIASDPSEATLQPQDGESRAGSEPLAGMKVAVVAMKPQIAGRIRRNIMTLLDMGAQVVVINSQPRDDFFQGLEHSRLSSDFVEVRSLAVRYQARMTRQKNERQLQWDLDKRKKAEATKIPIPETPSWMDRKGRVAAFARGAWASPRRRRTRRWAERTYKTLDRKATRSYRKFRKYRDLTVRDSLKKIHLVNRFFEFWRLSPQSICDVKPDLIVSSDLPGLVGASIAARRLRKPHLHDCHELYLESTTLRASEKSILAPIERRYMKRADAVVVVNETIRDEYLRRYGVRGVVLRNCAPAVPERLRATPRDVREPAGLPAASRVVLYQGGLVAGRGLDVCVRAARELPDEAHLVFIGKGRIRDQLESLADELEVAGKVHFLPAVDPAALPAFTAGADVGLIPYQPVSKNNNFALPNKVFEYTGAGIPFVASDLPELRRIVESSGCGEVYDPFDPSHLGAAVRRVLTVPDYGEYRRNATAFGRRNTWESESEILRSEIRRITLTSDTGRS